MDGWPGIGFLFPCLDTVTYQWRGYNEFGRVDTTEANNGQGVEEEAKP